MSYEGMSALTKELFGSVQVVIWTPSGIGVEVLHQEPDNYAVLDVYKSGGRARSRPVGLFVQVDGQIKFAPSNEHMDIGDMAIAIADGIPVANLDPIPLPWGSEIRIQADDSGNLIEIYVRSEHHFTV